MDYQKFFETLPSKKILVIGDLMLDHYILGDVYRISPEAPVPVVKVHKETFTAGGAANVALNLANLGAETYVSGYIGNDVSGAKLKEILFQNNIKILELKELNSDSPTIVKTRVLVRNQQLCRIDYEAGIDDYTFSENDFVEDVFQNIVTGFDAILLSDYAKGIVSQYLLDRLFNQKTKSIRPFVSIDPKPSRKLLYKGVDLMTPNRHEALQLAGLPEPPHNAPFPLQEVCSLIDQKYSPKLLVITLGADGMAICQNGKIVKEIPTYAKEVFDVSGAGDTVASILTAALVSGINPIDAAHLANVAAGCVVAHMGTVPINLIELQDSLKETEKK
jgi:D-beta-D-heptose 7-phosphate kinase/D-beta-D-heptose 1-phosphate adenosyltransferase